MRSLHDALPISYLTVDGARDYVSVPTRSTGTEGERELLAREMQKEMTASILRRIDAASRAPQPIGMPSAPPPVDEAAPAEPAADPRSEEHTSELQSLMRISYAVFCLKKKK